MNHTDHVALLREGVQGSGNTWADLGSGTGAFTLALADLLGSDAVIYSVDQDQQALREQEAAMRSHFPDTQVTYQTADFTKPITLPPLDGIVMANSLHFIRQKSPVLQRIRGYLRPGGRLILVEYNTDVGNLWVPHPLSFASWEILARENSFKDARLLNAHPSRFLREIYSALSTV